MNIYIPIATGTEIHSAVLASILSQTVAGTVVICATDVIPGNRRLSEANSRNKARNLVHDEDVYIMQDHNAKLLTNDVYEKLLYELWHNVKYDVVCANKDRTVRQDHHDLGVVACRGCVAEVPFAATDTETCLCMRYKDDLEKSGYVIGTLNYDIHYVKDYGGGN